MAENSKTTGASSTPVQGRERRSTGRFAAFDKTLQRFVGGVHDSQDKATKAAEDRDVESFEVREV